MPFFNIKNCIEKRDVIEAEIEIIILVNLNIKLVDISKLKIYYFTCIQIKGWGRKGMKRKLTALDISLAGMFIALMAVGANITSIAPFMVVGGVPITLQTFFAILAGAVLGSRLGAVSMGVYALVGLAGVPVFAKFSGGMSAIVSPTFGFILSFVLTAYAVGKLTERNQSLRMYVAASLVGMVINYVAGTNWMYMAYKVWAAAPEGFTYSLAWLWMSVPLPKDIALAICAGVFAYRLEHRILSRSYFRTVRKTA